MTQHAELSEEALINRLEKVIALADLYPEEVAAVREAKARISALATDLLAQRAEVERLRAALIESVKQLDVIIEDSIPTDWRMWRDDLKIALAPHNEADRALSTAGE